MDQADLTPVIIGVGELADRPAELALALEPAALMAAAVARAEADAGARFAGRIDGLEIINEISWPYADPCHVIATRIGCPQAACTYHPVGGQTPMLAIHRAALKIAAGEWRSAIVCGAEAEQSVRAARRAGIDLSWAEADPAFRPVRGADYQQALARTLDFASPTNVYPFYENATRAAWGQDFAAAQAESADIWAANAAVARGRETAWIRRDFHASQIVTSDADNRRIAWPYSKLMVANPIVNQGAAVILCSLGEARALGIAPERLIYLHGGAAADEPRDYLARAAYDRAPAMEAVLDAVQDEADGGFDHVELYSCFPVVPKMARRRLGRDAIASATVAGGLTFFGAPLNNYMTHAAVAMVERLRVNGGRGLLYGQGEYVTKHHALIFGSSPSVRPLVQDFRVDPVQPEPPPLLETAEGSATVETYTILFDRDGSIRHGGVIARTESGGRVLARVPASDAATLSRLMDPQSEPIGAAGRLVRAPDGISEWRLP